MGINTQNLLFKMQFIFNDPNYNFNQLFLLNFSESYLQFYLFEIKTLHHHPRYFGYFVNVSAFSD